MSDGTDAVGGGGHHGSHSAEQWKVDFLQDTEGLSAGYRMRWRLLYTLMTVFGPADRQAGLDPRRQLMRERAQRVLNAHRAAGTEATEAVHWVAESG